MRKIITLLTCLCVSALAHAQLFPVVNLKNSGPASNRINMVILPDGFTAGELPTFQAEADTILQHVFLESPMKEYANFYNAYCINVPSVESGTDHPATATDVAEPVIPYANVNTYFNCTFDGNYTHRALTCNGMAAAFNVLAANFPAYDQVIMLANSFEYGGTGGAVATCSRNAAANETARHELGHSFAGLADEYWAPGFAAEKPNMTTEADTNILKWNSWLHKGGVGHFRYGSSGGAESWYRPHQLCKMQYLNYPFCHVCQEAFIDKIYQVITPIDSLFPSNAAVIDYTVPTTFRMKLIKPIPYTLSVKWQLNGFDIAPVSDTSIDINGGLLPPGVNALTAYVTDTTPLSHSYRPEAGYMFSKTWYIRKSGVGVISITNSQGNDHFFYKLYPVPVKNDLTLAYDNTTRDESVRYSILDISGKTVRSGSLPLQQGKQTVSINVSGIIPGNYILRLNSAAVYVAERITIE